MVTSSSAREKHHSAHTKRFVVFASGVTAVFLCFGTIGNVQANPVVKPQNTFKVALRDGSMSPLELTTLGGGCFWCLDAVFRQLKGVSKVESGYSGGQTTNPTYREVCSGETGHAEVIQITYDPATISLKDLFNVFFTMHDPTTLNRQGGDTGTQYRSIIMYHDEQQKHVAEDVIKTVNDEKWYGKPVVTQVVPVEKFYPAEGYHQDYYNNNPSQGYCRAVIAPKVSKLRSKFLKMLVA